MYHAGYYSDEEIESSAPRRSNMTLPGALFERDGYKQIGWATWPYSSIVEYGFGDTYRTQTSTVHFYAVWQFDWDWFDAMSLPSQGAGTDGLDGASATPTSIPAPTPSPTATPTGAGG